MDNFDNKTALITGASRGIGAAIFSALGTAGARVIGTATTDNGKATIERVGSPFGGIALRYDATDAKQSTQLAQTIEKVYGGVDIMVANAAITADSLLIRLQEEAWERVLEANLSAVFRLTRHLLRGMIKRRYGRIIILSSITASIGNAGQTNYCAAKAGIEGYCRALAKEAARRHITVNAVAPGFIATDMTADLPQSVRDHYLSNIPAGRAGEPEEVAALVTFLASSAASYITGQVIHINGGLYMG